MAPAKVKADDRKNYGFPDGSYPCKTSVEMDHAIDLRHNSKDHGAAEVLSHVARMAGMALREKRISKATYDSVMNKIKEARAEDAKK